MQIFFLLPWRRMLPAFYRETALLSLEGRREGGEEAREGLGSQGSRLELQESLRESRCQKIFPKLLSKDKRTNSTGRLLPGKYTGLERVNVFSPPSVKWPSNKSTFNCITPIVWWQAEWCTSRWHPSASEGPASFMQTSKPDGTPNAFSHPRFG